MANLYKKTYPKPMPDGAEVIKKRGKPVVRWTDKRGNEKLAPLAPDGKRMMYVSEVWYARYRDHAGQDRRFSTGCRDEQTAQKKLNDVIAQQEKLRIGLITVQEIDAANHEKRGITSHIDDYVAHLRDKRVRGRKVSKHYIRNIKGRLNRVCREVSFKWLSDISADEMNRWLNRAEDADMATSTRNEYLTSMIAFCNWLKREKRIPSNPLESVQKADRSSDRRHLRRALTVKEISSLLTVAQKRPIAERGRETIVFDHEPGARKGSWTFIPVDERNFDECYERGLSRLEEQPRRLAKCTLLGQERALFYLLAVSTGLRRKELTSLTVSQVVIDDVAVPMIHLKSDQAKSGKEASIPLRGDVVERLRSYLNAQPIKKTLNSNLFDHPPAVRIFDADCRAAGIAKTDERGRVVDIHALRTTFGTHLAVAGVHPRVAQAAMRHSRIELTTNYYTDPILLDVSGAVNSLPAFTCEITNHVL